MVIKGFFFININMDICRACMGTVLSNFQSIFENNLRDLFQLLTNITISEEDGLPKNICNNCIEKIKYSHIFRLMCIQSDILLKKELAKITFGRNDKSTKISKDTNKVNIKTTGGDKKEIKLDEKMKTNSQSENIIEITQNPNHLNKIPDEPMKVEQYDGICILKECEISSGIDEDQLDDHMSDSEKEEIIQNTKKTKKKLNTKPQLSRHYVNKNLLEKLDRYKKNKDKFPFKCKICNRGFMYQERFEGHLRAHDGKKAAVCEICNREYTEWSNLQKHMEREHKDDMKYNCHCGKSFMYESGLATHKITHSGERSYICENCGKSFSETRQLNEHLLVHQTDTPFGCDQCDKKFKNSYRLRAHQFRHTGIRNYKCVICEKSFITGAELRYHTKSHSSKMYFDCKLCGKLFRHKNQVSIHMRSHESV